LEQAQLDGSVWFIEIVRVVGQEPLQDAVYNGASKVGCCSGCVFQVLRKLSGELVTPSCPKVAELFQAGISRSAASEFPNANW
jgi:hypothetical protein